MSWNGQEGEEGIVCQESEDDNQREVDKLRIWQKSQLGMWKGSGVIDLAIIDDFVQKIKMKFKFSL